MRSRISLAVSACLAVGGLAGCESATLSERAGMGPHPALPAPNPTLLPTADLPKADSWESRETPLAAPGLQVTAYARGLDHPRWLYRLPNGDVLVAETNAPPGRGVERGFRGFFQRLAMRYTGGDAPSANRIRLFRDADRDGSPELESVFLESLNSPFGMALVGNDFYVANTDALVRFRYTPGATRLEPPGRKVARLPAGRLNAHWARNVIANRRGDRLYVTVGANSNVGEGGMEIERWRAAILEVDPATRRVELFASGLRNPNGLAWHPKTGALWTTVNERDELGSDLVPDYMTSVERGGFYGWPYSYFGRHVDPRVQPARPDLVAKAIVPDYALGPHTASLGLAFNTSACLPKRFAGGAFVAQHGSWNRDPPSGYKVILVPFHQGRPAGLPLDVLAGFLDESGRARGRPVGVTLDATGALLVADDVGNAIWRVAPASGACERATPRREASQSDREG